ncbi:MAG: FG-GAP repeat protein [Verrucomicrobia bacterium]|nr:FG-GAP repeat protein [Verrucomicrobiota bacterium]
MAAYQAPNRANNLRFTFSNLSVTAERRAPETEADCWRVTFTLQSYGQGSPVSLAAQPNVEVTKNAGRWASDDAVLEYSNEPDGLHQSFLINRRPVQGRLVLDLAVRLEGVQMALDQSGSFVSFTHLDSGAEVMQYSGLAAFDATGRDLPAQMQVAPGGHVLLVVDDSTAQYPVVVDPWYNDWSSLGGQAGAQFGFSVAYLDLFSTFYVAWFGAVAIGAPWFDGGAVDQGAVFVFYTDLTTGHLRSTPDFEVKGSLAYDHFGYSLAAANNATVGATLNNDDKGDLIVGEPDMNYSGSFGAVKVWYGTFEGLGTSGRAPDWTAYGAFNNGDRFGFSVATGDVTGDGFFDVIIGAPNANATTTQCSGAASSSNVGAVILYKGSSSGVQSAPASTAFGLYYAEALGHSVAYAGLVRGGSYPGAVVAGAPYFSSSQGRVAVYYGSSSGMSVCSDWNYWGSQSPGEQLGYSVFGGVDVNNDGFHDIAAGAPYWDNPGYSNEGRVLVFKGSLTGPVSSPFATLGPGNGSLEHQAGCRFGYAIAGGNVNADAQNFADLIIGAPYWDTAPNDNKGKLFVYWGGTSINPNPEPLGSADPTITNEHFGSSVAFIYKLTDPSQPCLIGGAPDATKNYTKEGMAVVWRWDDE